MAGNNGILYAVLIVLVLMAAVIVVQQEQIKQNDIKSLPFCEYSSLVKVPSLYEGYYVGMDANRKIVCAHPLTKEGTTVDLGL